MVLKIEPFPGGAFIQAGYPSGILDAFILRDAFWYLDAASREGSEPPRPCLVSPRGPSRASSARRECRNHSRMTLHSHAQCTRYEKRRKAVQVTAQSIRRYLTFNRQATCHTVEHTTKNATRALAERVTQTIPSAQRASATDTVGHRSPGSMSSRHIRHHLTHSYIHPDREAHRSLA